MAREVLQMTAKGVLPVFQEFLLSHKLAPEKHVPLLAVRAGKFLAFSKRKGQADIGSTCLSIRKLTAYSYLSASIGSSKDALYAG
jgi:hypothetical protein